ncbi:MAG: DUF1456 family protein [Granulosicoccus sp.]
MDTNDYTRRIRYALQLDDAEALRLITMGGLSASLGDVEAWRSKESDAQYKLCPDEAVLALLNGLVLDRRGPPPADGKARLEEPLSNNLILKQLRIALTLRTDDVFDAIQAGGGKLGKSEVGAFFRKPDARNYRKCGDQVMRWFLAGLAASRD